MAKVWVAMIDESWDGHRFVGVATIREVAQQLAATEIGRLADDLEWEDIWGNGKHFEAEPTSPEWKIPYVFPTELKERI